MVAALKATPKSQPDVWRRRILQALAEGPATHYELMCELGARQRRVEERAVIQAVLDSMIGDGRVLERSELSPARGVRFRPVMVLELSEPSEPPQRPSR